MYSIIRPNNENIFIKIFSWSYIFLVFTKANKNNKNNIHGQYFKYFILPRAKI